ncbi:MAG: hypothetical protein NVSMB42_24200 [Herpetosiphon sp.]
MSFPITTNTKQYAPIRFDNQMVQSEFERLVGEVIAAEQARAPLADRQRTAEGEVNQGALSQRDYDSIDRQFIAANNKIAAAKKAVDAFLSANRNYKIER